MIDFGDLEVAEEVGGESIKLKQDEERRAWERAKEERRTADEREREERVSKARVKYQKIREAKALEAERLAEKERTVPDGAAPKQPAPAAEAKTLTGKEERKQRYKWLLHLDEDAMKVASTLRPVDEDRVLETPEEEKIPGSCWQIICAGPPPDFTDIQTLKQEIKKSDILSVFGPAKPSSSRRAGRFSAALAKGGLAALSLCKRSKRPEDGESTVDPSEISTADPTEAWEGSEEDLSSCDGRSEPGDSA
uniref:Uncharacterized protein n=1 Tax=Alexandrium monilatum TaxID=311494 RepID=A0A7S4VGC4_9DINO|mmetsp:Transcript_34943/g.104582  ORF Transcript_34943/g.104582 Transcript_34943/m.104582 type:complete len:250 (-) Transcript_34943:72-821(-)